MQENRRDVNSTTALNRARQSAPLLSNHLGFFMGADSNLGTPKQGDDIFVIERSVRPGSPDT